MRLGWYIHHHGRGHLHRFLAVAPHLSARVTVLSSLERPDDLDVDVDVDWLELPLDVPVRVEQESTLEAGGLLHWAPTGSGGYRDRMSALAAWVERESPDAIVVDVSVEVALLARLLGVPVIWVAQRGDRTDRPHQLAFATASRIIAPWSAATHQIEPTRLPADRLVFTGALSRFDGRGGHPAPAGVGAGAGVDGDASAGAGTGPADEAPRVLLLLGGGGHTVVPGDVGVAAAASPAWRWEIAGLPGPVPGANVTVHEAGVDVWTLLGRASVVVASASGNAIAEVAAARRPLLLVPQTRPFAEQIRGAEALSAAGLGTTLTGWPSGPEWPGILDRARTWDVRAWSAFHDGAGARRFAAAVQAPCA